MPPNGDSPVVPSLDLPSQGADPGREAWSQRGSSVEDAWKEILLAFDSDQFGQIARSKLVEDPALATEVDPMVRAIWARLLGTC